MPRNAPRKHSQRRLALTTPFNRYSSSNLIPLFVFSPEVSTVAHQTSCHSQKCRLHRSVEQLLCRGRHAQPRNSQGGSLCSTVFSTSKLTLESPVTFEGYFCSSGRNHRITISIFRFMYTESAESPFR
jgi:hypothetical protein